ncbi:type IV pilus modification protein PilV [Luteimonas sp. TWI1437]|uniref:type IV pilus modification protein PilV n=1 Tax=unclassified Luteimonas TaxID=2629088 RepID=UPI00320986C2
MRLTGYPRRTLTPPRGQRGVSLIEVLVAVVVLGIGLLGTAALQAVAMRAGQSSLESSMAVVQTNSIIEAMRANVSQASSYNMAMRCDVPTEAGTLAQRDLRDWMIALKTTVGAGAASATGGTAAAALDDTTCASISGCPEACSVVVQWDDSRARGNAQRQVKTVTRL